MANVFTKIKDPVNQPKRNTFDLSFANNLTLQFGAITPCFVKEVIPGDSFSIEPRLALKLMPMIFPVQTDMRAYVHFFYVRNRNLWKDWTDFIGMLPGGYSEQQMQKYEMPYIRFSSSNVPRVGSLSDYLGLPTTLVGRYGQEGDLTYRNNFSYYRFQGGSGNNFYYQCPRSKRRYSAFLQWYQQPHVLIGDSIDFYADVDGVSDDMNVVASGDYVYDHDTNVLFTVTNNLNFSSYSLNSYVSNGVDVVDVTFTTFGLYQEADLKYLSYGVICAVDSDGVILDCQSFNISDSGTSGSVSTAYASARTVTMAFEESVLLRTKRFVTLFMMSSGPMSGDYTSNVEACQIYYNTSGSSYVKYFIFNSLSVELAGTSEVRELDEETSPYYGNSTDANAIKVNALPYRAYESIYNCFYRDPRNNPYVLNGSPEYNKWCPTTDGGEDTNDYPIRYRNWEADFITTALQSPQQGTAPLVGLTNAGTLAFMDEDGLTYKANLEYNEDKTALTGINITSSDEPVGTYTRLIDFATSGFTINDLRGVNALQRWLEINARRGYRYKDQVKSHFDVDIRFDELDMPEFIGGMSSDIYVNQISQTVNQSDSGSWQETLGAYGGQGFTRNTDAQPINHYFDEHGFVIGVIMVVPTPCYSQLLPKHFLKRMPLDYYFPEFGKLGMQPITYKEVCPVQTVNSSDGYSGLDDTFGYQRAWYDYLASTDEVHGLFRTNMRNFLINRVFDTRPELGSKFLTVQPNQINQVFAVTEMTDKIFGQLYFKVSAKRPIPEYGIPSLE